MRNIPDLSELSGIIMLETPAVCAQCHAAAIFFDKHTQNSFCSSACAIRFWLTPPPDVTTILSKQLSSPIAEPDA